MSARLVKLLKYIFPFNQPENLCLLSGAIAALTAFYSKLDQVSVWLLKMLFCYLCLLFIGRKLKFCVGGERFTI